MTARKSGILCHITSLPGRYGIGDFYKEARIFADFMIESGAGYWQILPLNPTEIRMENSPFNGPSAFALNPLLISPDRLAEEGFLNSADLASVPKFPEQKIDYPGVVSFKISLLYKAYEHFKSGGNWIEFERFCREQNHWLDDFSLFICLRNHFGGRSWSDWPKAVRDCQPEELSVYRQKLGEQVEREKFIQWQAYRQWYELKEYCFRRGLQVIGDTPIYVHYESADVWTRPHMFKLDKMKKPLKVTGVPPDYFSKTGQIWGNPVYDWKTMKETGFEWWTRRIKNSLELFHILRLDHFRGLVSCWEIPAGDTTAEHGSWVDVPGKEFFNSLQEKLPVLHLIAEDLGMITEDVKDFLKWTGLPGMHVLQFGIMSCDGADEHLPHNHPVNSVAYTGTHDNNTIRGWYRNELDRAGKRFLNEYTGKRITRRNIHWEMIRLGMISPARIFVFPIQDAFGLGRKARMNIPSTTGNNWRWRFTLKQLNKRIKNKTLEMNELYGRRNISS